MSEEYRFNPNEHLMQIGRGDSAKDYLPVAWRLVWFREQCPQGTIDTEEVIIDLDREVEEEVSAWNAEKRRSEKVIKRAHGYARFRAIVTDGKGGRATGTKSENAASFPDYIEKAETGAIGRALAALGYGTQFAPDLEEAHRIVDSPVDRTPAPVAANGNGSNASTNTPEPASEELVAKARKMYQDLGRQEPPDLDRKSAKVVRTLMEQMSDAYRTALNTKNGHPEQPASSVDAPDALSLRKRCSQLQLNWDELQTKYLGKVKQLKEMTADDCAKVKRGLDIVEENRLKQAIDQQKAS